MTTHNTVTGSFSVKLTPHAPSYTHETSLLSGRLHIDKHFEGPLSGHSQGEMLSVLTADRSAGGYVAMEVFSGTLNGMEGTFALQHYGKTGPDGQSLLLEVVPGSGSGALSGLVGTMVIRIEQKQHYYDFSFSIA